MKYFVLFAFLLLPLVSASTLTVLDDTYLAGETVQAEVEGEIVMSGSISLLDSNGSAVSITPLFSEYREGLTLLYFHLPEDISGEYTLTVGSLQESFTVVPGDALQIKPGIIILDSGSTSFSVYISALDEGATMLVQTSDSALRARKSSVTLPMNSAKYLYVDYAYSDVVSDMYVNLSYDNQSYIVPVIFPGLVAEENESVEENVTVSVNETVVASDEIPFVFLVTNPEVALTLNETQSVYGDLKAQNLANDTLSLHYSLTGDLDLILSLNETDITLASGEVYSQRIWFNRANNSRVGTYEGLLVLESDTYAENLSIAVTIVASVNTIESSTENVLENQTIDEYTIIYEGETLAEESTGNGVYIIGVVLILLLLGLIVLVALKLRQKGDKKFNEYIEETKRK